ncbi:MULTISPECIES: NnrU family protein [Ensifer]|uniref:NnrU family protein n=1 Tax=Ensifer canadensis TaxID=555315 RepID=A0AAW4FHR9_9HYPH|nr:MULTISPECIES: NnrU family protein [Ensifer]KQW50239.1 NnrU family protein [Ensifer sp. Root1252]KRC74463.1 NnrU family protein [Ensifer sp. Root231]KRD03176.1 NnrU family protein [Ensifer sp. Root258]MBM3090581.1 NnrU family protein [Ensifer canadensis]UBI80794.1 NnrU family protein [Ensifer canadensis]
MYNFLAAFAVFLALHMVPALPTLRQRLITLLGRRTYFTVYSLLSIVALIWVFQAALALDFIPLWEPAPWQAWTTFVLAPLGLFLVLAGLFSENPLSISIYQSNARKGAIVSVTRHPVLCGFLLWALGHVVANGDLRSLVLFGGFALFALGGFLMVEKRVRRRLADNWSIAQQGTSIWPFVAILKGQACLRLDPVMILSAFATAAITFWLLAGGHYVMFGADPLLQALPFD